MNDQEYRKKREEDDARTLDLLQKMAKVRTLDEFLSVVREGAAFAHAKFNEEIERRKRYDHPG